jgi:hypothetical protein
MFLCVSSFGALPQTPRFSRHGGSSEITVCIVAKIIGELKKLPWA